MEQEEKEYAIFANLRKVGSLWFDIGDKAQFKHCVIVRMRKDEKEDPQKTYYILVVQKKPLVKRYKRLGVREVKAPYILKKSDTRKLL